MKTATFSLSLSTSSTSSTSNLNPIHQHQQVAHGLRQCCLITDGNSHRADLCANQIGFQHNDLLSEAMLPEIRTVALMIAAQRHDFQENSPSVFADEADWFAARIIVLQARFFHLDVSLSAMLHTANQRAQAFAQKHHLPFQMAGIRPSLHAKRPANMLLMECDLLSEVSQNVFENTQRLRKIVFKLA